MFINQFVQSKSKVIIAFVCLTMWCALVLLTQPAATFAQKPDDQALQEKYEQAGRLFDDARFLANQNTSGLMQEAISKFEAVRRIYQETNSRQDEAKCLVWLGSIANRLEVVKISDTQNSLLRSFVYF